MLSRCHIPLAIISCLVWQTFGARDNENEDTHPDLPEVCSTNCRAPLTTICPEQYEGSKPVFVYDHALKKCKRAQKTCSGYVTAVDFKVDHFESEKICKLACGLCPTVYKAFPDGDLCLKLPPRLPNKGDDKDVWYFNYKYGSCKLGIVEQGFPNRFETESECEQRCPSVSTKSKSTSSKKKGGIKIVNYGG